MPRGEPIKPEKLFIIALVAILGIYLWSQFTGTQSCTQADITAELADENGHGCKSLSDKYTAFIAPSDKEVESLPFQLIRFLIIGVAIWVGLAVTMRVTSIRLLNKRDILSLVILGVVIFIIWQYIIVGFNLLDAQSINDITMLTVKKIGLK